jgi:hypothetical protein
MNMRIAGIVLPGVGMFLAVSSIVSGRLETSSGTDINFGMTSVGAVLTYVGGCLLVRHCYRLKYPCSASSSVFSKIRTAFFALYGVPCAMLIAMCVRSYWWTDFFPYGGDRALISQEGSIGLVSINLRGRSTDFVVSTDYYFSWLRSFWGFHSNPWNGDFAVPYWLPALFFAGGAAATWARWRFSLRMLIVALTFFALLMGLIAYVFRKMAM